MINGLTRFLFLRNFNRISRVLSITFLSVIIRIMSMFTTSSTPPFFNVRRRPNRFKSFLMFQRFIQVICHQHFRSSTQYVKPRIRTNRVTRTKRRKPRMMVRNLTTLVNRSVNSISITRRFYFPHRVTITTRNRNHFHANSSLKGKFVLFSSFIRTLLSSIRVISNSNVASFRFTMRNLTRNIFSRSLTVKVRVTCNTSRRRGNHASGTLITFRHVSERPISVTTLVSLNLRASAFVVVRNNYGKRVTILTVLFTSLLRHRPFLSFVKVP